MEFPAEGLTDTGQKPARRFSFMTPPHRQPYTHWPSLLGAENLVQSVSKKLHKIFSKLDASQASVRLAFETSFINLQIQFQL